VDTDLAARHLHFVGSLPQFADPVAALLWQLNDLRGQVRRLTAGETGARLRWFVPLVKELMQLPQIRVVRSGDWTGYDDTDRLSVYAGGKLQPDDIPVRLAEYARSELATLESVGMPATRDLPLQVGVPGYFDMALFIFGPLGVIRHAHAFRDAVSHQISDLYDVAGDRVVFQLEVPAALVAVSSTPKPLRSAAAKLMARLVTRQVARAPRGSRFGLHLCLGDLGHRPLKLPETADPQVRLANALCEHWPQGRTLDYVHLPLSGGDKPPVTTPKYYLPLHRLTVPRDVVVIAGIAHEKQAPDDQRVVRDLVEKALGRSIDIATACGLGRRTPEQAERAVQSMQALLT
jgi:hypothetical protein